MYYDKKQPDMVRRAHHQIRQAHCKPEQGRGIVVQITRLCSAKLRKAEDFSDIDISLPKIKKLVKAICRRFKLLEAAVGIAIVDDSEIRKVNKHFLNRNYSTDVISFDLSDQNRKPKFGNRKLFELIVNGQMAVREGKQRGHSSEAELALYITHGLLHNLGFDDSTKKRAKKMHQTEDEILQQFGYGSVYNKSPKAEKQS